MDFWLVALANLPEDERRIAMARACGIPWQRLEEMDGRSHTALRKIEAKALQSLTGGNLLMLVKKDIDMVYKIGYILL